MVQLLQLLQVDQGYHFVQDCLVNQDFQADHYFQGDLLTQTLQNLS